MTTHTNDLIRNYSDEKLMTELDGYVGEPELSDFALELHAEYVGRIRALRAAGGDVRSFGKVSA